MCIHGAGRRDGRASGAPSRATAGIEAVKRRRGALTRETDPPSEGPNGPLSSVPEALDELGPKSSTARPLGLFKSLLS